MDRRVDKGPWSVTVKLASGITPADVGKAVSIDGTNANQFRLSADADVIDGRLEYVEEDAAGNSTGFGTVCLSFLDTLPIKTGETVVVNGSVQGAGAGEVKPLVANKALNYVVEVRSGFAVVRKA